MGTSVAPSVTDEELDKHVRDLLIKDAKKRAERYGQQGIRAYLASGLSDSNAPKPNKRFLSSVIKSTDEHNKAVLKAQALSAEEIKREKREQEMKERRARAEEAVQAEKMRRSGSSRRSVHDSESWDRWDGTTADRKRKRRNWETWTGDDDKEEEEEERHRSRRRKSHRSRSPRERDRERNRDSRSHRRSSRRSRSREGRASSSTAHKHRSRSPRSTRREKERSRRYSRSPSVSSSLKGNHRSRSNEDNVKSRKRRAPSEDDGDISRRRSRSPTLPSDTHSSIRHHFSAEPSTLSDRETELRKKLKSKSTPLDNSREGERATVEPSSSRNPLSKLSRDEHTRSSKEPRSRRTPSPEHLKVSRSSSRTSRMSISRSPTPGPEDPGSTLPSKMDRYFEESYDPRLDVAPLSTAPKVPATGLIDSAEFEGWDAMLDLIRMRKEDKAEKKRLERMGLNKEEIRETIFGIPSTSGSGSVSDRWSGNSVSVMDIQYSKRGSVREWDMGKEGF
ncbi:hypothetical protein GYMLUDRAFT_37595 [Collybiopsis luxurians FD-317 M1]|nr:hypothetical protein GYMLUDRAFT_37595 [Collybiopsis luxurians FD-317 M1]